MGAPNQVFIVFAFLSFILVSIPLPWHLEAWNTGTCLVIFWTGTGSLIMSINAIIWDGNTVNWAPIWCDITTRLMTGLAVGIPAASLCINRRLYTIASIRSVTFSKDDRRRAIAIDLAIGLGIPVLVMALHYIVQGHRFDIFEDVGCRPFTFNTPLAYPLVGFVPLVIGLISGVYSVLIIRSFYLRSVEIKAVMSTNNTITFNRYFRLMALATVDLLLTIPFSAYIVYANLKFGKVSPWISWERTHFGFSRINQIPAHIWRSRTDTQFSVEFSRWAVVACGFSFFMFFGFAEEAIKNYRKAYACLASRLGTKVSSTSMGVQDSLGSHNLPVQSIPVFIFREVIHASDSKTSLSDTNTLPSLPDDDKALPSLPDDDNAVPPTITTGSWYSQNSALALMPPERRPSFPVSVAPSTSFLDIITPQPQDSMLSSVPPHDRV
jgi:pheromone a factor receptor